MARSSIILSAIRPPQFDDSKMRPYLVGALGSTGRTILREFEKTVSFWETKPEFKLKLSTTGSRVFVEVYTDNPIYGYLNSGVGAHSIIPRKNTKSGTAGTYFAGSIPGTLSVDPQGGEKEYGFYLNLNWVIPWPGIKARDYETLILDKVNQGDMNLKNTVEEVFRRYSSGLWRKPQ